MAISKGLFSQIEKRHMCVYTGKAGIEQIDRIMQRIYLDPLLKEISVTPEERVRLNEMLDSPDYDNFIVAKAIINEKYKSCQ